MKILQVLRAPTGGLWRHVVDLSGALASRGHEVGIVFDASFSDAQTVSGVERLEPRLKLGIQRLPISRQPGLGDIRAGWALRRMAAAAGADVVHGHGAKGGLFARLTRAGSRRRVAVYTPHGGVLNYHPDRFSGRLYRWVEKGLLPFTDGVVFESAFAQKAYCEQIGTPACASPVIHNGLQPADLERLGTDGISHDFVFVGEIRAVKGIPYLIEALTKVKRADGGKPRLLLVGGGPDEEACRRQIGALGLTGQVDMAGVQPARAMFAKAGCVVIPSLAESLPYVVLEAAGAGRQVITTRVGGIAEIFGPTADRLVPPGDAAALAVAMQAYLDDPAAAQAEIDTRHAFVSETFSIDHMADAIAALYETLVSR